MEIEFEDGNNYDSDGEAMSHPVAEKRRKSGKSKWKSVAVAQTKRESRNEGCIIKCKHKIDDKKRCRVRTINIAELHNFHKRFWKQRSAIEQRKFIQTCISITTTDWSTVNDLERQRKTRDYTIHCHIQTTKKQVPVCKEALLGILSIGRSKLEFAAKCFLQNEETMVEKCGGRFKIISQIEKIKFLPFFSN